MSLKQPINVYVCSDCGGATVTRDVDQGVTPFMLRCRARQDCRGMARSSFYTPTQFPPGVDLTPRWEWYRPTGEELKRLDPPMREHVRKGGLDIRPAPGAEPPPLDTKKIVARCVNCRGEFTEADIEGRSACPSCGAIGVPMDPAHDVEIKINWHELHILVCWAEFWAGSLDRKPKTGAAGEPSEPMLPTVYAIAKALQDQCPSFPPLTLSGEVEQLRELPGVTEIETNIPKGGPLPPKINS